jgi:hypothetical protein
MAILQIFGSVYFNVEAAPGFGAQPWAINFGGYFYDKAAAGSKYRWRLARFRDAASGFNGNTGSIPGVIFHLRYEPSTYRDSNNRNCARANDRNDRANDSGGLVQPRPLLRQ